MKDLIRGPWFQTADSDWSIDTPGSNTYTFIHDENDDPVAIVAVNSAFDKDDELDAKAALIEAAPDLLVSVRLLLECIKSSALDPEASISYAEAAVAKAEGSKA